MDSPYAGEPTHISVALDKLKPFIIADPAKNGHNDGVVDQFIESAIRCSLSQACGGCTHSGHCGGAIFDRIARLNNPPEGSETQSLRSILEFTYKHGNLASLKYELIRQVKIACRRSRFPLEGETPCEANQLGRYCDMIRSIKIVPLAVTVR